MALAGSESSAVHSRHESAIHFITLVYRKQVWPVGEEAAGLRKLLVSRDHRQRVMRRKPEDLSPVVRDRRIVEYD
jgi:hypothetical protein